MSEKINIETYFKKGVFVIPEYQRGYKWSVEDTEKQSSLAFFIDSLITAYNNGLDQYFIEAVTVVENQNIVLVDGQQRTTSLFLIFAVLEDFDFISNKLKYDVREDSHKWLNNLIIANKGEFQRIDTQDIFYFIKALELIALKLKEHITDNQKFLNFVKKNVFLLYNPIPKDKAINTFISLNGLKAVMKEEELIKSDLLIKSSRIDLQNTKIETSSIEWKINEDRGILARNWDKWLYWWNQKEVKNYFGIESNHPLYYLLITYWNITSNKDKSKKFSFDNFKNQFISSAQDAKTHFEGLRKLQKTFEDLYSNWEIYNLLGLAIIAGKNKQDVLIFFIQNRNRIEDLKRFVKWSLVGCTLKEIEENNPEKSFYDNRDSVKDLLKDKELYESEGKHQAYLQLLRINVLDMNNRKFDFEVFKTKSLEHICPQNPPENEIDFLNSKIEINEKSDGINSIGNLVLLNGSANSALSNNDYGRKKQLLFDKIKEGFLLPHTLKVFSKSFITETDDGKSEKLFNNEKYWQAEDVKNNKEYFFNEFDNYYEKKK